MRRLIQYNFTMKEENKNSNPAQEPLRKKIAALKKAVARTFAAYEKQFKICEEASHKKMEKGEAFNLRSALKIAKFTYKIKKTELKIAKNALKNAEKAEKKNAAATAEKPVKTPKVKVIPAKATKSAAVESKATKVKNSPAKSAKSAEAEPKATKVKTTPAKPAAKDKKKPADK